MPAKALECAAVRATSGKKTKSARLQTAPRHESPIEASQAKFLCPTTRGRNRYGSRKTPNSRTGAARGQKIREHPSTPRAQISSGDSKGRAPNGARFFPECLGGSGRSTPGAPQASPCGGALESLLACRRNARSNPKNTPSRTFQAETRIETDLRRRPTLQVRRAPDSPEARDTRLAKSRFPMPHTRTFAGGREGGVNHRHRFPRRERGHRILDSAVDGRSQIRNHDRARGVVGAPFSTSSRPSK